MASERTLKVVEINGNSYNINHFPAAIGSWITLRLMKAFREYIATLDNETSTEDTAEQAEPANFSEQLIQMLLTNLSESDFEVVQRHALNCVTYTDLVGNTPFEQPIILKNGNYANPELAVNIQAILVLTSQALFANLSPFFTKTGLKAVMSGEQVSVR